MKNLWIILSIAVFVTFSYLTGGVAGLISAALLSGLLLVSASNQRFAGAFIYFFLGFASGFIMAIAIAHYVKPTGIESALLFALPIGGSLLALWYGKRKDFTYWPVFGYRYRL